MVNTFISGASSLLSVHNVLFTDFQTQYPVDHHGSCFFFNEHRMREPGTSISPVYGYVVIMRVDKTDLDSYFYFDTGKKGSASTGDGYNYAVQEFNGTIWAIFATEPGTITSINPNSLEFQNYSLPYNIPNEILSDGKRLFITYWDQDPGKVQAFDPSYLVGREIE